MFNPLYIEKTTKVPMASNSPAAIEKNARKVFSALLEEDGYSIDLDANNNEADIVVKKNGLVHYYEIKSTTKDIFNEKYFGSASFTEWKRAFEDPDSYSFVIAVYRNSEFKFYEVSVEQMMEVSTIPPIVVFFNITAKKSNSRNRQNSKQQALRLTKKAFENLIKTYKQQRDEQK